MSGPPRRSEVGRAGNKRKRSSSSSAAASPTRKQAKISIDTSPGTILPARDIRPQKQAKSSAARVFPSMKDTIESHIDAVIDSWLANSTTIPSITPGVQPLNPSSTYIYLQLDLDDPNSYVAVPLPSSLVAEISALPSPRSSPEPPTTTTDNLGSLPLVPTLPIKVDTAASSSFPTPPRTPPRASVQD
ncbi:hypothetical protein FKW77_002395 [Venturia effusa]|uniref:Uncharacterized protein n=1 Tax=Venturia effusa TaxID=50376 RepID=A0A517L0X4_9PEZI|nr:hypothetical protein FKW77_002395 [Venturia effusa]